MSSVTSLASVVRRLCSSTCGSLPHALHGNAWPAQNQALQRWCHAEPSKSEKLSMIKELRAQSGAPLGDVKSSLQEAKYDIEIAFEALRKKGIAAAAKKSTRTAGQGLIGVASSQGCAALVELNSETDFVARSDLFTSLLTRVARSALSLSDRPPAGVEFVDSDRLNCAQLGPDDGQERSMTVRLSDGVLVADAVTDISGKVRERIALRRCLRLCSPGYIATYVHNAVTPDTGLVAAAVSLESDTGQLPPGAQSEIAEVGKHLAMQVVAMTPIAVTRDSVPAALLDKEREILRSAALEAGKPEKFVDKMVQGRLGKFMEENVLLEQKFILNDKITVQQVLNELSERLSTHVRIGHFLYMKAGDASE